MPQEYSTRTPGSPAPSPSSFGSEPMKLDQPNFVAQTNVAKEPDVFGALQEILGLGAKVGIQFQDAKTQAIKDNISLENAKQAKLDRIEATAARADATLRREDADKLRLEKKVADQLLADHKLAVANATTPEEAERLEAEFLKKANEAQAAGKLQDQEAGLTAVGVADNAAAALRRDKEILELAPARKIVLESAEAVTTLVAQADADGLRAHYNNLVDRLNDPTLTDSSRNALIDAASRANSALHALQSDASVQANAQKQAENATYSAVSKLVEKEANAIATHLSINVLAVSKELDIRGVTDDSIHKALYPMARDLLMERNPALGELLSSKNPIEAKAASEALDSALNPIVSQVAGLRREQKGREHAREFIDSVGFTASNGDPAAALSAVESVYASPMNLAQQRLALSEIGIEFVNGPASRSVDAPDAVALQMYQTVVSDLRMPDEVKNAAHKTITQRIKDAGKRIEASRFVGSIDLQNPPNVNAAGVAVPDEGRLFGYSNQYVTELDALNSILGKHYGLTVSDVRQSDMLMELLGPQLNKVSADYKEDDNARLKVVNSDAANVARANKDERSKMDVDANFNASRFGKALADGTYVALDPSEVSGYIQESLQGYRNTSIPKPLLKLLTEGIADPNNRIVIREFWQIMKPGENPEIDLMLVDNKELQLSYSMGLFMKTMRNRGDVDSTTEAKLTAEFHQNILAANKMPYSSAEQKTLNVQKSVRLGEAMAALASGAGIDTGFFDVSGYDPLVAFASMGEGDQVRMFQLAQVAASAPEGFQEDMMTTLLKEHGFAVYQPIDGQFNLVNNSRGYSKPNPVAGGPAILGTRGLPMPEEVDTLEFKLYLKSLSGKATEFIKTLPSTLGIGGATFTEADIESIRIAPFDQDLREGRSAVAVKYRGKEFYVPIQAVSITDQDFYVWRASEAGKALVKKAQEDAMPTPKLGM